MQSFPKQKKKKRTKKKEPERPSILHSRNCENTVCVKREEEKLYFTDGQNLQQLLNRRRW